MKKILIALGVIVVLLVLAVLIVPALIPVETYKEQILAQVKQATGREARIDGDFKLSILPSVEFVAGKVSFANAPGAKTPQMVTLDRMTVRVALFPLIGGNIEIAAFVLEKPVINLEIDKSGKPNWQFGAAGAAGTTGAAKKAEQSSGSGAGMALGGVKLGDVRLVDGIVTYTDARGGEPQRIDGINLTLSLPSLDSPMTADGSLVWNREKIALTLGLSNPNAFLAGRKTDIETRIDSTPVKFSFKGSAAQTGKIKAGGDLDLDVPSIRKLAAWVGAKLDAPGSGYGPLKIAGKVEVDGDRFAFRDAKLSVDAINGTGEVAFDGGGRKPSVVGRLKLDKLDLNPYLPPESKTAPQPAAKSGGAAGKTEAAGWSDDPIDLAALNGVDAKFELSVGGILLRKIKIGAANLNVTVKDGVLVTDLTRMALYGGTGKARLTANGAGKVARIAMSFDLANFQANPFMVDAMDFDRIEGAANANLKVTTRGRTQRELVSALNGAGGVKFLNGAIRGINLAAMVRNVATAFLDSGASKTQKTDFAELGGTYRIVKGIVTNTDLLLKSPLLRLTGKGTVDLPKRRVKYRLEPKLVASTKGQGGAAGARGITVPIMVKGPWDNISYAPDLTGMIGDIAKDPAKAVGSLKNLIPGLGGKSGGSSSSSAPSSSPLPLPIPNPADALKKLFGR
jgi:AsmA protein